MNSTVKHLSVYLPQDRLRALASGQSLPDRVQGAALFVDISGFTPLTEKLTRQFGARRGVEELTQRINAVYGVLIQIIERQGGSVIGFAGDAITCWFDTLGDHPSLRAVSTALAMQEAMRSAGEISIKAAVTSGPARRFGVGDPQIQLFDTLAGETISRLAAAEHLLQSGEAAVDEATQEACGSALTVGEFRTGTETDERFAILVSSSKTVESIPARELGDIPPDVLRAWIPPAVYTHAQSDLEKFLPELRPGVALFLRFAGIDYDQDESAGQKLDELVQLVQHVSARYEGALLQITIGDKGNYLYLCFGAPIAHEDDSRRAVRVGMELRQHLPEFPYLQPVQIGISQGILRIGAFGGVTRRTYGAMGDEVNLAARLMSAAQPGEILTSGRVQQSLGEQFTFEPRPPLRLKGKAEPLPVFAVTGLQRRRATRLLEPAYRLPMIGRLTELKRIAGILDLARQGKGQIVGITAEAGMGKSRLVAEAIRLAHAKGFAGYGGACESSGTHTPYLAWKAVWQAFFDVDLAAPDRRQLRNLEGEIEDRAPDRLEAMPLLAPLLDLPIEDNDFTRSLEPKDRHNALTALLEDCLKAAAKEEPVLIVLEDVHWIDALSHNLLEDLARATASSAVCFVLAYRPPETGPGQALRVEAFPDFTKIALSELAPGEAEQLIRAKLAMLFPEHNGGLPQALVKPLTDLAQGNPFYLEELLNYLHDRGISPYDKQAMSALELPSSLHTLILSRIDRLSEKQKTALKAASIIGRLFPFAWLHGYYPALGAPKTVKKDLNELARLDLTPLETPEPELTYLFKHIITHDVAYENLAYATRAQLHEQLARYLETQDTERRLDLLAFHYGRSENLPKQREYLHKAGDAAQEAYANDAAVNYYERLLDLLPLGDREWMEISLALGRVLQRIGQGTSAENRFRQALAQARQRQDQSMIAQCEVAFAELMIDRDQNTDALIALDQARARFSEAGDRLGLCQALALSASAHFQISKAKEENLGTARVIAEECVALARQVDSGRKLLARALNTLAGIAFLQDEDALKQAALEECLAIRREIGDRQGIAFSLYNLGFYAYRLGDYERTRPVAEESLALFYQLGDKYGAIWPRGFLGWLAIIRGDYSAAHSYFKENFTFISEQGSRGRIMAASLKGMGVVAYLETDFAAARDCFDQALEIYRSIGDSYQIPMVLLELALAKLEQGIISQASQHVLESLALTRQLNFPPAKVGGLIAAARLALEHGELAHAARLCGAVEALTPQLKPPENFIDDVEPKAFERTIEALKQRLDPARLAEAWAQGKGMALDEAVQFAVEQGS